MKKIILLVGVLSLLLFALLYLFLNNTPKTYNITIQTKPIETFVTFDGKDMGIAPVTIKNVQKGEHEISIKLDGFDLISQAVNVRSDKDFYFELKPITTNGTLVWKPYYKIEYKFIGSSKKYYITLYAIQNRPDQYPQYLENLRQYKQEALGWLKSNVGEVTAEQIEYIPSLAKDL